MCHLGPLPFIAGCLAENSRGVEKTIDSSHVQHSITNGLSVINLVTGDVLFTTDEEISHFVETFDGIIFKSLIVEKLDDYQCRIEMFRKHTIRDFFKHGYSNEERSTLKSFRELMYEFFQNFAGDIAQPNGWKYYGAVDAKSGSFKFCPTLFIEHLKYLFDFQEVLVQTRLFNTYFKHKKTEEIISSTSTQFTTQIVRQGSSIIGTNNEVKALEGVEKNDQ